MAASSSAGSEAQPANRIGCLSTSRTQEVYEAMIGERINDVDVETLRVLVADRVGEGKTLEYKREMPAGGDRERVRFLKAVSAFANTAGGDLLLGVEAVDGVPTALPGLDLDSPDGETLRLENMIREGLEPRIPRVDIRPVKVAAHRHVLVVRITRSWIAPHRVRKNREFYARNSAGTYPLDVGELRTAFTMSESLAARIRDFRTRPPRQNPWARNPGRTRHRWMPGRSRASTERVHRDGRGLTSPPTRPVPAVFHPWELRAGTGASTSMAW